MYKAEKDKPWYGKRCEKCDEPINYAYAAKGPIPGWCGRCTVAVREKFKDELSRELRADSGRPGFQQVTDPHRRLPSRRLWFALGLLSGAASLLALSGFGLLHLDPLSQVVRVHLARLIG